MVDKNELRASFSERLHEALDEAGVRSRGRGVDVHNHLKSAGVHKSPQAISKWLNGDAIAEADSMIALCTWLGVRREWLEYGVCPKKPKEETGQRDSQQLTPGTQEFYVGKVPLISWTQAASRCGRTSEPEDVDFWMPCPVAISELGYALTIIGDSMMNPGPGRSYPSGCIIFVDPLEKAKQGDRVVAKIPNSKEVTFKVLVEDAGKTFLKPINPQYPFIDITEGAYICGKVVGSFVPE